MNVRLLILSLLSLASIVDLSAQVKLPRLISDGMILQQHAEVKIWGWSAPKEEIAINFLDTTYALLADEKGHWELLLSNLKAGGPYTMNLTASNSLSIHNILIGDVWLCSGQSNMETPMRRVSWVYPEVIEQAENPSIRQFKVPRTFEFSAPHSDFASGEWISATPETVLDFSAVGYFFACEIFEKYGTPIGIINAALGGSPIEAWLSEDALKDYPDYYNEALKFRDSTLIQKIRKADGIRSSTWYQQLGERDAGYKNTEHTWRDPLTNTSDWKSMQVPGYFSDTELGAVNGVVWFKKECIVPPQMAEVPSTLILGRIVDADSVFVNGKFVGTTGYQYPPRRYTVPKGYLHAGKNTIVVRLISNSGSGGFVLDKAYELVNSNGSVDLSGLWQYKLGAIMEPLESQTFIRWKPMGLYNAMIHPLLNYPVKGVLWYQGESNTERAGEYATLMSSLIKNWRSSWGQNSLPFIFVQLPNFMKPRDTPENSNWALLREAQLKTLTLPHTAMAVTIDVGEWNDIHPLNKSDVGKRLAWAAMHVAYGDTGMVYSGPIFDFMEIDGNNIILNFTHTGTGLASLNGQDLTQFAIAGADKKFVWAKARIEGAKVIVWSPSVLNPVAVRYAWADNPEGANLGNKEALPASPFRTDNW